MFILFDRLGHRSLPVPIFSAPIVTLFHNAPTDAREHLLDAVTDSALEGVEHPHEGA